MPFDVLTFRIIMTFFSSLQTFSFFAFGLIRLFVFISTFQLLAQISWLRSKRHQSQQWQFNIERWNNIDAVWRESHWPCRTNEPPFVRKRIVDYHDNEEQPFNCGNRGTKCEYWSQSIFSSDAHQDATRAFIKRTQIIHFLVHFERFHIEHRTDRIKSIRIFRKLWTFRPQPMENR